MSSVFILKATGNTAQTLDLAEIRRALGVLADPRHGVQLQAAPSWACCTVPAASLEVSEGWGQWLQDHADATGIYYALNPVPSGLTRHLKVGDVICRRWLLIDVDRHKAEGTGDLSATHAEHEAARDLASAILDHLAELGWPAPLLVDSGNGFHLLYRVDLPNDSHARVLLRQCLKVLAEQFDGERGSIGRECHDARRIAKLPGTWARKGPHSDERPHRKCQLLYVPDPIQAVTAEQLGGVAGIPATGPELPLNGTRPATPFVLHASNGDGGQAYAKRVLETQIGKLTLTGEGQRNNALNAAAFLMGGYIAGGAILRNEVEAALVLAAYRCGLGEEEAGKTIRSGLDAGSKQPIKVPERNGQAVSSPTGKPSAVAERPRIYRMTELLDMDLPAPSWAVQGVMSEGLSILAGKPKLGKSWMALNLALTIAAGGLALGAIRVVPGNVLYLSLEDRLRRVQDRARKLLRGLDCAASDRLEIAVTWPKQNQGGYEYLHEWLAETEAPRLVIIDVWQKFRPALRQGSQYEQDYEAASAIKSLADSFHCSVLILHHCKKADAEDVVDEISGTLGLAGSADGLMILSRARSENEGKLFVSGRDVEEQELALLFDPATFCWKSLGDARQRSHSKVRQSIQDVYKQSAGAAFYPAEMANLTDIDAGTVKKEMWRMAQEGLLKRVSTGKYSWPIDVAGGEVAF